MRVFLYLSYNGSKFKGFAPQPNRHTVLDKIVFAAKSLKIDSTLVGSGRTDANVHALNQVVHLDIPLFWDDLNKLKNMLNRLLHPHIHIKKISYVLDNAHARFDAKKRLYRYICYHGDYNPILSDFVFNCKEFDINELKKIIKNFEGKHDFSFFKKMGTKTKDDIREIYKANVYRYKKFTIFTFLGSGFLRSQIRAMMGAILYDDSNKESNIKKQLDKKERIYTKFAAPNGLYLSRVYYDTDIFLAH